MPLYGEAKREYQRKWKADRRAAWFSNKECVDCGAKNDLQLDHVDPESKLDHKIWSWSWERILKEVAKCVVRCVPCHQIKTKENMEYSNYVLNKKAVEEIRLAVDNGATQTSQAIKYGVAPSTVSQLIRHVTW